MTKTKPKLDTRRKLNKKIYAMKAEGSRISNRYQKTWDQLGFEEEKE